MTQEAATAVYATILTIGAAVWLFSLTKALRMGGRREAAERFTIDDRGRSTGERIGGEVTVGGDPDEVGKGIVQGFRDLKSMMVRYTVVERTPRRVVLEKRGPLFCNQPQHLWFSGADFQLKELGGYRTQVTYQLDFSQVTRGARKIALLIICGVGLPVLALAAVLIGWLVVPSDSPAVRWQVFQTLQIVHALWPPFLVMGLAGAGRAQAQVFVENLIESTGPIE